MPEPDRHRPLPPLTRLPAHVWRGLPRAARAAVAVVGAALIVTVALLAPRIADTRHDNAARERRDDAAARQKRVRDLRELQRPRRRRSVNVEDPGSTAARRRHKRRLALRDLERAVAADARGRGAARRIRRVECDPLQDSPAPERDLTRRRARMSCLAVTSDIERSRFSGGGTIGFPYLAVVDFRRGQLTWCRVAGQAGEGGYTEHRLLQISTACGG